MRHRYAHTEAILFAIAAISLWMLAATSLHIGILNAIYPSGSWTKRGEILRAIMVLYGAGFALASVGSFIIERYFGGTLSVCFFRWIRSVWGEAIDTFRWLFATEQVRRHTFWLALIVTVGVAVRCFFLTQPMRYDEAYTFVKHVNNGLFGLFFYPVPNNHVLHTLLVRISVEVFGSHPAVIRLPALVAGLLNIPLIFALTKSLNDKSTAGFMAASLMAVYPYLVLYDTMARGYSLLILLSLCLVAIGLRIIRNPSVQLSVMMALPIALGLFDMPSFLLPATGVMLWLAVALLRRGYKMIWILVHVLIPCAIVAATATIVLYTPVAITSYGIDGIVGNSTVQGEPWNQFLNNLPGHIMETVSDFSRGIPTPIIFALFVLLIGGLFITARERRWTTLFLLPPILIGAMVVLFAKHAIPFPRTWIYFLPFIFLFIDAGLAGIPGLLAGHLKKATLILSAWVAVVLMSHNTISSYPDTGYFPEAPILVDILSDEMTPSDRVIAEGPASYPTYFYMWYNGVPARRHAVDDSLAQREFVVVKTSAQTVTELTKKNVRQLISIGNAELYVTCLEQDTKTFQQEDALEEK